MTHSRPTPNTNAPTIETGLLVTILLGYLFVAGLYTTQTPPWQAPDEPAHYNYIAQIAGDGCCPVIEMGDWDNDYLDQLKAARFDPALTDDLSSIQYEDHQPPLYYALAAVAYRLGGGSLVAVRLLSVVLGAGVVLGAYGLGHILLPGRPGIRLGAAALVAFIPQHVAILSSANNDALTLPLVAAALFLCAHYLSHGTPSSAIKVAFTIGCGVLGVAALVAGLGVMTWAGLGLLVVGGGVWWPKLPPRTAYHLILGTVLGAAFVTKTTAYFLLVIIALAVVLRPVVLAAQTPIAKGAGMALKVAAALSKVPIPQPGNPTQKTNKRRLGWRMGWGMIKNAREIYAPVFRRHAQRLRRGLAVVLGVGFAFGALWWGRNIIIYGAPDILGLVAHDEVVVGQLRTAERIEQVGWAGYWQGAFQTTFNSFWGQLGWMALPLPADWYPLIGGLLVLSAVGLVVGVVRARRRKTKLPSTRQVVIGALLGLTGLAAVAQFAYYNLTFYQVQGRYLFVALVPFALAVGAGLDMWRELAADALRRRWVARYTPYVIPLGLAAAFGAMNLWLVRFVLPFLAPG